MFSRLYFTISDNLKGFQIAPVTSEYTLSAAFSASVKDLFDMRLFEDMQGFSLPCR